MIFFILIENSAKDSLTKTIIIILIISISDSLLPDELSRHHQIQTVLTRLNKLPGFLQSHSICHWGVVDPGHHVTFAETLAALVQLFPGSQGQLFDVELAS